MAHNQQWSKGALSQLSTPTIQSLLAAPICGERERETHADQILKNRILPDSCSTQINIAIVSFISA